VVEGGTVRLVADGVGVAESAADVSVTKPTVAGRPTSGLPPHTPVSRETQRGGSIARGDEATATARNGAGAPSAASVSRETRATSGPHGGATREPRATSTPRAVSRETSRVTVVPADPDGGPDNDASRPSTTVTKTGDNGQTAAESGTPAIDRSPTMHEVNDVTDWAAMRSTDPGVTAAAPAESASASWRPPGAPLAPAHPYEDEQQRQTLVGSLPRVDESTPLAFEVAEDARRRISLVGRPFPHPPRTRILTVANQKGGVGKTTTTVNVAAAMAQAGLRVLVLDIDPQGNASTALGIDHHADIPSLYDVVVEGTPLADVLQPCPDVANLWCAPATIDLAGAEIELVSMVAREMRLQKALDAYLEERQAQGQPQIDYIFIDCPPSLSLLTINAFVAATEVFIPIQCEYYALEGLSQLLKHIDLIRGHLNPRLHVSTILLTMYDGRTRLSAQVADEVRAHFAEVVCRTSVPRSVRISEAPSHSQTVMTYDPASSGALSYLEASRELAEQVLRWAHEATQEEHA
jgi:chromosome partitioning protein